VVHGRDAHATLWKAEFRDYGTNGMALDVLPEAGMYDFET